MGAAPLDGRFLPAAVWTGREILVWGGAGCQGACDGQGVRLHADGGAYDPVTDIWRLLPPSPLSARSGALAVWTGRELVVWGGMVGTGSWWTGPHSSPRGTDGDPSLRLR